MSAVAQASARAGGHLGGALAIALTGLIWSAGGLFFRLLEGGQLWPILIWRYLAVTLFFAGIILGRRRGRLFAFWGELGWKAIPGALCFTGASVFFLFALDSTTVFNALMMLSVQPLLAAALAWVLLREPVKPATWVAMALAAAGIFLMVQDSLEGGGFIGNVFALASSLCFAAYTVFNRAVGAVDTAPLVMVGGFFGILIALAVSSSAGYALYVGSHDILLCIAMSLLLGLGFLLFNWGIRRVPAAEALVLAQTEVIFGPLWVWLVFTERPSDAALLGGLVLFAAVLVQGGSGLRRKARVVPPAAAQP